MPFGLLRMQQQSGISGLGGSAVPFDTRIRAMTASGGMPSSSMGGGRGSGRGRGSGGGTTIPHFERTGNSGGRGSSGGTTMPHFERTGSSGGRGNVRSSMPLERTGNSGGRGSGGGMTNPQFERPVISREERKGNRRNTQAFKVDKKQEEEAAYFFQCVDAIKTGRQKAAGETYTERELFGGDGKTGTAAASAGGINFDKYDSIVVTRSGPHAYDAKALDDFQTLQIGLPSYLCENIRRMKYTKPTPIQKHAIPLIMDGRDVLCAAQTGSGKTFAFLLPLLKALDSPNLIPRNKSLPGGLPILTPSRPRILVLAPTRELAIQIHLESMKLTFGHPSFRCVCVYGGANAKAQLEQISGGVDLLVATPGRLTDFLNRDLVYLGDCHSLVLDEADRMLDMGFEPQIKRIMRSGLPPIESRQTCMFSATFPTEIQLLAKSYMRPFVYVAVGRVGSTTESITQNFLLVEDTSKSGKTNLLLNVLSKEADGQPTIIFCQK